MTIDNKELKAHTGQSIEAILGEAEPPDLATISTDVLAAEVERRGLRVVAAEYVQTIDQARAEGAAEEREACAKIARDVCESDVSGYLSLGAREIADAIRVRKDGAK